MTRREEIIGRLAKLKALAEGGIGGERENAARMLEVIAARHGVDLAALEGAEAVRDFPVEEKRGWAIDLMAQLLCLMRIEQLGDRDAEGCQLFVRKRGRRIVGRFVRCTEGQWVELMAKFSVLSRDYERQLKAFFRAFLEANGLLAPARAEAKPSAAELEKAEIASRMAWGITKSVLRRQIGDGAAGQRQLHLEGGAR